MLRNTKKTKDDAVKKTGGLSKSSKNVTPKPSAAPKKAKESTAKTEDGKEKTTGLSKGSAKKETSVEGRSLSTTAKKTAVKKAETLGAEKVERSAASAPGTKSSTKKASASPLSSEKKVTKPKTRVSESPAPALKKTSLTGKKTAADKKSPAVSEKAADDKKTASKKTETKGMSRSATPPVPPKQKKSLVSKILTPKGSDEKEKKTADKSTLTGKLKQGLSRLSTKRPKTEGPRGKTESPTSVDRSSVTPKGKSATKTTLRPSQSPAPVPKPRRKSTSELSTGSSPSVSAKSGVKAKGKAKKKDATPSIASTLSPPPTSEVASEDVSQMESEALSTDIGLESKPESIVLTEGGLSHRSTLSVEAIEVTPEAKEEQFVDKDADLKSNVTGEEVTIATVLESSPGPRQSMKVPTAQEMEPPTTMSTRSATPRDSRSVSREDDDDDQTLTRDSLEDTKVEIHNTELERALGFEVGEGKGALNEETETPLDLGVDVEGVMVERVQESEGIKDVISAKEVVLDTNLGATHDEVVVNRMDEIAFKDSDIDSHAKANAEEDEDKSSQQQQIRSSWPAMNEVVDEGQDWHLEEDAQTEILETHEERSDQATVTNQELNTKSTLDEVFTQILTDGGFDTRSIEEAGSGQADASAGGSLEQQDLEDLDGFDELLDDPVLPPRSDLEDNRTSPALTPKERTPELGSTPTFTDLSDGEGADVGEEEEAFYVDDLSVSDDLSLPDEILQSNAEHAARMEAEVAPVLTEAMPVPQSIDSGSNFAPAAATEAEQVAVEENALGPEGIQEAEDNLSISSDDLSLPEEVVQANAERAARMKVVETVQPTVQEVQTRDTIPVEDRSLPKELNVELKQEQERLSAPDTVIVEQGAVEETVPASVEVHATEAEEKDEVPLAKDDAPISTPPEVGQSNVATSLSHTEETAVVGVEDSNPEGHSPAIMSIPREDAHEDLSTPDGGVYGDKTENEDDLSLPDTDNAAIAAVEDDISLSEALLPGRSDQDDLSTPGRTFEPQPEAAAEEYDEPTSEGLSLSDWPSDNAVPSDSECNTEDLGPLPDPWIDEEEDKVESTCTQEQQPKGLGPLPERPKSGPHFDRMQEALKKAPATKSTEPGTCPTSSHKEGFGKDVAMFDRELSHQEDPIDEELHHDDDKAQPSDPPHKSNQDPSRERNENRRRGRGRSIVTWAVSVLGVAVTVILLTQRGH